ncbi:MAG: AI-2E family transporter [Planctomycetes bacterium]|nr:AI-2E family transporter [Planctomycetota bacterium]
MDREAPMVEPERPYTFDRVARLAISAAVVVGVLFLLRFLSDVLIPFVAAVVLAYLLNPLVTAFERRTKRRGLAVALTLVGLAIVGFAATCVVVPLMVLQAGRFRASLETLRTDLAGSVQVDVADPGFTSDAPKSPESAQPEDEHADLVEPTALGWRELEAGWAAYREAAEKGVPRPVRLQTLYRGLSGTYLGRMVDQTVAYTESEEFRAALFDAVKRLAVGGWSVLTFVLNVILGITGLIVVLLYLVFLLVDYPTYARNWKAFLPPQYRDAIVDFLDQFNLVLRRYFRGQAAVAIIVGTLFAIGFSAIQLPMAVPLGLFIGLLNMVPYLQMVGLVPALTLAGLRALEQDSSFAISVVLTLAVFAVVQIIQDALIVPRVMGKATGLRPVAVLLGVFIWGKLLGFLGLLLAIPLTCLGIAYYRRYVLLHEAQTTKLVNE